MRPFVYVTPSKSQLRELDDLNGDFVDFAKASIDVKVVPLTDLDPAPGAQASTARATSPTYYYGGHPHTHLWFWNNYGWYAPRTTSRLPSPALAPSRPPDVSSGAAYRPALRPTIFSSRTLGGGSGVGKQKPSGFGRVSVRTSKSTGSITAVRGGRSGAFGRPGRNRGGGRGGARPPPAAASGGGGGATTATAGGGGGGSLRRPGIDTASPSAG